MLDEIISPKFSSPGLVLHTHTLSYPQAKDTHGRSVRSHPLTSGLTSNLLWPLGD